MNALTRKTQYERIDTMTREHMARLIRFTPIGGDPIFQDDKLYSYFMERFEGKGGWEPALSKRIGWGEQPDFFVHDHS